MREGEMREHLMRALAIVLMTAIACASYWYSVVLRKPGDAPPPRPGSPDFVGEKVSMTQFDEMGRARYRLFSQEISHYAENDDMVLTQPRLVTLYLDRPQVDAHSLQGYIENNGERVLMRGSVRLTRAAAPGYSALSVRTEALTAWPDDDRYLSETRTEIEQKGEQQYRLTEADRMLFDNVKREIELNGQVHTVISPTPTK